MTAPLKLGPGVQLASTVCTTRVIVVRAPAAGATVISCGGAPMVAAPADRPSGQPAGELGTVLGKRYVSEDDSLEVLCTFPGTGELGCDGAPMTIKAAQALPASD